MSRCKRGVTVDLSNNMLTYIPDSFSSLIHLKQIDLSHNSLRELPESFGQLVNLRHLDLYANQLKDLPLGFANLVNLTWLDLKNNPLNEELRNATGKSTTPNECALCAQKILQLLQMKQKRLEIELKRATAEDEDSDKDIVFIEEKKTNKVIEEIILTEDEDNAEINSNWEESVEVHSPVVKSAPFSEDEEYELFDQYKDQEPHEEDEFVFIN